MAYDAERRQSRLGADRWQRLTGVGDAWGVEGAAVERNSSPHSHGSRSPEYFRVSEAGRLCELRKHGVERPPCAALRAGLRPEVPRALRPRLRAALVRGSCARDGAQEGWLSKAPYFSTKKCLTENPILKICPIFDALLYKISEFSQ